MALGFEFNGKKEGLLEIIISRMKENDNRFHELVRRLASLLYLDAPVVFVGFGCPSLFFRTGRLVILVQGVVVVLLGFG